MVERYKGFRSLVFEYPAEHVLRVTINAPERMNALSPALHHELETVWREIDRDPDVRVSIVTGAGRAFCAGMDFGARADEEPKEFLEDFDSAFSSASNLVSAIVDARKPIISAINGAAVGAGLAVALLADIPIAATTARLLDGHLRIGVVPGDHAAMIWPLLCGIAKSKYFLLTNEPMTGLEAERNNLVALAVEPEELQERALAVAVKIAKTAPTGVAMTKYAINHWLRQARPTFDLSLAFEIAGFAGAESRDAMAAMMASRAAREK